MRITRHKTAVRRLQHSNAIKRTRKAPKPFTADIIAVVAVAVLWVAIIYAMAFNA